MPAVFNRVLRTTPATVVSLAIFGGTSHRHRQVRIVPKLSRDAVRTAGLGTADCKNGARKTVSPGR